MSREVTPIVKACRSLRARRSDRRRYSAWRAEQLEARTVCEARSHVIGDRVAAPAGRVAPTVSRDALEAIGAVCTGRAVLLHHRRMLSALGALRLRENTLALCNGCHLWTHAHPEIASAVGLIVREGHRDWADLGRSS